MVAVLVVIVIEGIILLSTIPNIFFQSIEHFKNIREQPILLAQTTEQLTILRIYIRKIIGSILISILHSTIIIVIEKYCIN